MTKTPRSVGIYCRLSYADDGSEEKVERQEADCRNLGDRLAWPINETHVYKDPNRSAWQRNRKRPGWDAMLQAIEDREIDGIIVYHGDRLLRQPYDLEKLISIAESKGIRIASVTGTRNLDSPDDRYILRIEAAGFCRASDDSSRRILRAGQARTAAGLPRPGGTRAFGFERDNLTVRRTEADVIVEAADRWLAGQSNYGVVMWARTVSTTTTGGTWKLNVFRDMVMRPRIAGLLRQGEELVPAAWDPILPRETWEDLRALLQSRAARFPKREQRVRYLLSGIALCATCGHKVNVHRTGAGPRTPNPIQVYWCANDQCTYRVGRTVANLDRYVVGRVLRLLNDPQFVATLYDDEDAGFGAEIVRLERRKAEAQQQLENLADYPGVSADMAARSVASFTRKIDELRTRRETSTQRRLVAKMAGVTQEQWDAEPLDVRRSTVASLFDIVILPATSSRGRGFDPRSVRVMRVPLDGHRRP